MKALRQYECREAAILASGAYKYVCDNDAAASTSFSAHDRVDTAIESRLHVGRASLQDANKAYSVLFGRDVVAGFADPVVSDVSVGLARRQKDDREVFYGVSVALVGFNGCSETRVIVGAQDLLSRTGRGVTETAAAICWSTLQYAVRQGRTASALDVLFKYVEDAFDIHDLPRVDCLLAEVEPDALHAEMLISVLRATSRAKRSLSHWHGLLEAARVKVEQEGLPPRLLRGL